MRYLSLAMSVLVLVVFAGVASAQESYYIRQNGAKYQQALGQVNATVGNVQALQGQIGNQRAWYNQGMSSRNLSVRRRAKRNFLNYMKRLQNSFLQAERAYGNAIYWGSRYAKGLQQLRSRAAQGRQVATQVQGLRNAQYSIRNTRAAVEREARAASRRN